MQVMARCRSQGLSVSVQDIIRSDSIPELATRVTFGQKKGLHKAENSQSFDLSPIQQVYFHSVGDNWSQFNQSVLLRLSTRLPSNDIRSAMHALIKAHSMLRARFERGPRGEWHQRITSDISGSYRFCIHNIAGTSQVQRPIENSQESLDIENGPICAVDLFNVPGMDSQLSIVVHHLVIDVVSWRIILQDLEDVLNGATLKQRNSLSFQAWCGLQSEQAQNDNPRAVLPTDEIPAANFKYWGMEGQPNLNGDIINDEIEIESQTTAHLLDICHGTLKADIVDTILAAIIMSFQQEFPDRDAPTIFNEGHGREPWDESLDLSSTVGWFTTLSPTYLPRVTNPSDG